MGLADCYKGDLVCALLAPDSAKLEGVSELLNAAFSSASKRMGVQYIDPEELKWRIDEKKYEVYAFYKDDGVLVASVHLRRTDGDNPDHLYLGRLAVDPSMRGKGVGVSIMKASINYAKNLGKKGIRLNHFRADAYLQKYYNNLGFISDPNSQPFKWKGETLMPMVLVFPETTL